MVILAPDAAIVAPTNSVPASTSAQSLSAGNHPAHQRSLNNEADLFTNPGAHGLHDRLALLAEYRQEQNVDVAVAEGTLVQKSVLNASKSLGQAEMEPEILNNLTLRAGVLGNIADLNRALRAYHAATPPSASTTAFMSEEHALERFEVMLRLPQYKFSNDPESKSAEVVQSATSALRHVGELLSGDITLRKQTLAIAPIFSHLPSNELIREQQNAEGEAEMARLHERIVRRQNEDPSHGIGPEAWEAARSPLTPHSMQPVIGEPLGPVDSQRLEKR